MCLVLTWIFNPTLWQNLRDQVRHTSAQPKGGCLCFPFAPTVAFTQKASPSDLRRALSLTSFRILLKHHFLSPPHEYKVPSALCSHLGIIFPRFLFPDIIRTMSPLPPAPAPDSVYYSSLVMSSVKDRFMFVSFYSMLNSWHFGQVLSA